MPRVLQTLFYLLRYDREEVCERDTNKLDFKKVKTLMTEELFKRMSEYEPFGQSEEGAEYKVYQKLGFIKKNIESVEEEKVDEYNIVMGRIHRWVTQAIDLRVEDIRHRRDTVATLMHEREVAVAEDKARTKKREEELATKTTVSEHLSISVTDFANDSNVPLFLILCRNSKKQKRKRLRSTLMSRILTTRMATLSRKWCTLSRSSTWVSLTKSLATITQPLTFLTKWPPTSTMISTCHTRRPISLLSERSGAIPIYSNTLLNSL